MNIEDKLYPLLKVYKKLPYPLKYLIGKIYTLIPNKIKHGKFYYTYYNRTKIFEIKDIDTLLSKQMTLAVKNIPFYKNIKYLKLHDFPIINKEIIIRTDLESFINKENLNRLKTNSGGSSGTPFEFYLEKGISRPKEKAHFDWYWKKFGYKPGDKILMVRGESLADNRLYEYQAIDNKLAISCYLLNKENIHTIIAEINTFGPKFIHAYPSALKNFITLAKKSSVTLQLDITAVFLGSEGLLETDREAIGDFFQTNIAHWYGQSERLIHAGNCPYTTDFHIYPFYGFAELIDEEGNLIEEPGIRGRIIATGFDNTVMPFIRYDTDDEAAYSAKKACKCGFKGKSFERIYGRKQDYIYLSDHSKVSLTAFIFGQHFDEFAVINEIQLQQEKAGKLLVRLSIQDDISLDTDAFIEKMTNSVQNKLQIKVTIVNSIPKTARGKHVFLIQKIQNNN